MDADTFAQLEEAFSRYDTNDDGSLDRDELTAMRKELGPTMTEQQIEMGFQTVDEDESGRMAFDAPETWWEIVREG